MPGGRSRGRLGGRAAWQAAGAGECVAPGRPREEVGGPAGSDPGRGAGSGPPPGGGSSGACSPELRARGVRPRAAMVATWAARSPACVTNGRAPRL